MYRAGLPGDLLSVLELHTRDEVASRERRLTKPGELAKHFLAWLVGSGIEE